MSATYVLTNAAASDLRENVRYTRKQWGRDQVLSYVDRLQRGIEQLVANLSIVGKDLSGIFPVLRMLHCEHHYIFCLPRDDAPALIVAILHERDRTGELFGSSACRRIASLRTDSRSASSMAGVVLIGDHHIKIHHRITYQADTNGPDGAAAIARASVKA